MHKNMKKENKPEALMESCSRYAHELYDLAGVQARKRAKIDQRFYEDTIRYYGQYDETTAAVLESIPGSSKVFVNQTRPKTKVMSARLIDILFPNDEANWDVAPTPVPRFAGGIATDKYDEADMPLHAKESKAAKDNADQANKAVDGMRLQIKDQLVECGYAQVGHQVIKQACKLGIGICKGPFADWRMKGKWERGKGKDGKYWKQKNGPDKRPAFEWVDAWDFFPDMSAKSMEDCEFVFELHRMSRSEVKKLAKRPDFSEDAIKHILEQSPITSVSAESYFTEHLKYIRLLDNYEDNVSNERYLVFEYHGPIPYAHYKELCEAYDHNEMLSVLDSPDDVLNDVQGVVWFCDGQILKFSPNPLESGRLPYSIFRLDPSDSTMFGHGIPSILEHQQSALNAAWRMTLENGGLAGAPMFVVDRNVIEPHDGVWEIRPKKIFDKVNSNSDGPGIEAVTVVGNSKELLNIITSARSFMDDETNLPLIAQGDAGTGARQTAHGMTLLVNAVNIIFRNAARSFDAEYTIPNITGIYEWNMQFSDDDSIKGDMECQARGSSVLLVREVLAQNLLMVLNLAATNETLSGMVKLPETVRELFHALQLPKGKLVKTDDEMKAAAEAEAEAGGKPNPELEMKLQIEKIKADSNLQVAQMQLEAEMAKLASNEGISLEKINSDLEKIRETIKSKERLTAAEFAVKEKHGTGI